MDTSLYRKYVWGFQNVCLFVKLAFSGEIWSITRQYNYHRTRLNSNGLHIAKKVVLYFFKIINSENREGESLLSLDYAIEIMPIIPLIRVVFSCMGSLSFFVSEYFRRYKIWFYSTKFFHVVKCDRKIRVVFPFNQCTDSLYCQMWRCLIISAAFLWNNESQSIFWLIFLIFNLSYFNLSTTN